MTNKDKYLKDNVSVEELCFELAKYCTRINFNGFTSRKLKEYFESTTTPTLTEDERVILRNLEPKMWNTILREDNGDIAFGYKLSKRYRSLGRCEFYNHLFQFIKERRRI